MKQFTLPLAVAALALATVAAPHARAQGAVMVAPAQDDDPALGPDDDVIMREYVVRRAPPRVTYQEDIRLRPGSFVPGYVELLPMADTANGRFRRLAYFVSPDNKIVMVDPGTRAVVRILDQ